MRKKLEEIVISGTIKDVCVKCGIRSDHHYFVYGDDMDQPVCAACLCDEYMRLRLRCDRCIRWQ